MTTEITFSKNSISVTVYANSVSDGLKNSLIILPTKIVTQKQSDVITTTNGATKIGDLLDVKRTFQMKGFITSKTDKKNLIQIALGAGTTGGEITMSYSDGQVSRTSASSDTSFKGYFESLLITQEASDETENYDIQITFIEGTKLSGT